MNDPRMALWLLIALIGMGASAPIRAFEPEYVIVASHWDYPEALILDMDADANVLFRRSYPAAAGIEKSAVSPDGRVVILGPASSIYIPVMIYALFLDTGGNVKEDIVKITPFPDFNGGGYTPITFSSDSSMFFAGSNPFTFSGRHSSDSNTILITEAPRLLSSRTTALNYSSFSRSILFQDHSSLHDERNDASSGLDLISTAAISPDGSIGPVASSLRLPFPANVFMDTSIDGQWSATTSMAETIIMLVRNHANGTLAFMGELLISELDFSFASSIKFSPRYPFLYVLGSGSKALLSIRYGEDGSLEEVDSVGRRENGRGFLDNFGLAITPDGEYALFTSANLDNPTNCMLHIVRLNPDGTMDFLPEKGGEFVGRISDLAVTQIHRNGVDAEWSLYQ